MFRQADVVCFVSCVHPVAVLNAAFCMTCRLLMLVEHARGDHMEEAYSSSKKTRGWNATDICTNCVYSTLRWPSLSAAWLALLLTKAGDVESNPGPTTHTNKHTPVRWICDLCHKQIKKQQTSIRCNHTHR